MGSMNHLQSELAGKRSVQPCRHAWQYRFLWKALVPSKLSHLCLLQPVSKRTATQYLHMYTNCYNRQKVSGLSCVNVILQTLSRLSLDHTHTQKKSNGEKQNPTQAKVCLMGEGSGQVRFSSHYGTWQVNRSVSSTTSLPPIFFSSLSPPLGCWPESAHFSE